jgi:hypothetical protein
MRNPGREFVWSRITGLESRNLASILRQQGAPSALAQGLPKTCPASQNRLIG